MTPVAGHALSCMADGRHDRRHNHALRGIDIFGARRRPFDNFVKTRLIIAVRSGLMRPV